MFCMKCGTQIPDDSSFCPQCGASVSTEDNVSENAAVKAGTGTESFDTIKASDTDETQELNLEELVNEEISAPSDTEHKANGDDTKIFETKEVHQHGNAGYQAFDSYSSRNGYGGTTAYSYSDDNGNNGSAAAVRPSFWRSRAGKMFVAVLIAVVAAVAGLFIWMHFHTNAVDMFNGIDVLFNGTDGDGTIQISAYKYNGDNRKIQDFTKDTDNFYFSADKEDGLSNDDEVTVTLHYDEAKAKKYGLTMSPISKTYKVSGLTKASSAGGSSNSANSSGSSDSANHSGKSYSEYYLYETGYSYRSCPDNKYLWPTAYEYITDEDLQGFSKADAQAIINEIFADNGYIFKEDYWYNYFYRDRSALYTSHPYISSQDKVKANLTDIEKANLNKLMEYRH